MSTPNVPRPALTPHQRFLCERQQRQNTTFAITSIAMVVTAMAATLVFTGIVPVPLGNDSFVKVKYAETGDIPCPEMDAKPVAPSQITVTVTNATQHQGLAFKATDMLSTADFQTEEPANSGVEYIGRVRITAYADSVSAACPAT